MKQRLIELGCVPAKSLILQYPVLDHNMQQHFLRGYFDGDGSIYSYDNDYATCTISTDDFCQSIKCIILDRVGLIGNITKSQQMFDRGNYITSNFLLKGNRRVLKLMNWLYKDATIYLTRKYNKYLELKAWCDEVDSRTTRYSKITQLSA